MNRLLIATRNPGKFSELSNFLSELPVEIVSLHGLNIIDEVEENGKTYKENSIKKALFYTKLSSLPTLADDGGIEIDALDGAPGVKSRRYFSGGEKDVSDEEIIQRMIDLVKKFPKEKMGAQFKTVVTFALPSGEIFSETGFVRGELREPKLKLLKGYPYRSFFFLPELNRYYHESELTGEEMKKYNHRYKAVAKLKPLIKKYVGR